MKIANLKNKRGLKKILLLTLVTALVLFVGQTQMVGAQNFAGLAVSAGVAVATGQSSILDIAYTIVGKFAFGISYLIAWIMGVAIAIEAWLVGVVLNMNTGVFSSAIVQQGFGVTLAIANLGFVLGIIVIAIATILRRESYGVKQLLWKLVIAAILVNFGLVIMAPIFGFGNSLTQYFLNCIDPAAGGCSGNGNGLSSMNDFAKSLAGAFNPQNGFASLNLINNTGTAVNPTNSWQGAFAVTGSSWGKMLVPIFSLLSIGALLTVIVITLGALIIMLIIRYVYIAMLAVLMPFAWLMWVFPKLSHHWSKWWSNFFRWTFFAPLVVFFLYLAIVTAQSMSNASATGSQSFATYTSNSNMIWGSISSFFTNIFSPIIQTILNQVVLVALCVGGIFAANSLGIAGADVAMKAVGVVKDSAVGYVGKQTRKGARLAYQKAGGDKLTTALREGRMATALKKKGFLGSVAAYPVGKVEGALGRGAAAVSTNEKMVEDAKKNVPKSTEDIKSDLKNPTLRDEDRFARIAELVKRQELNEDDMVGDKKAKDYISDKDKVSRYGQGKLVSDTNKLLMSNDNYRAGERTIANEEEKVRSAAITQAKSEGKTDSEAKDIAKKAVEDAAADIRNRTTVRAVDDIKDDFGKIVIASGAQVRASELMNAAMKKMLQGWKKEDASKVNVNSIFGPAASPETVSSRLVNVALYAPHAIPNLLKNMKSPALQNVQDSYTKAIDAEIVRLQTEGNKIAAGSGDIEEKKKQVSELLAQRNRLDDAKDTFEKALTNNKRFIDFGELPEAAAGGPPPSGGGSGGGKNI
jgi:hypothetical protein